MATAFPGNIDNLTNPTPTEQLAANSHASAHSTLNDAIEAIETKVGKNSSIDTNSHDYKLSGVTSTDKAESTGKKGVANGYASLDVSGKVPAAQLPAVSSTWGAIGGTLSDQADLNIAISGKEVASNKNIANGYCPLDAGVKVPEANLPGGSVSVHNGLGDPHSQYQLESEKGVANGYASLGADGKVPAAQLPAATGGSSSVDFSAITGTPNSNANLAAQSIGNNWEVAYLGSASDIGVKEVAYGNGYFVAIGETPSKVYRSADGVTWSTITPPEANAWQSITFGGGLFVAVASSGTNRVMTSPDGLTWTPRAAAQANLWISVTYGAGKYVAVSLGGTNRCMTSADGITWTVASMPSALSWGKVKFVNNKFIATASDGTTATGVATSNDGTTWAAVTVSNAVTLSKPFIEYFNGKYYISSTGSIVMSSVDATSGSWSNNSINLQGNSISGGSCIIGGRMYVTSSSFANWTPILTTRDGYAFSGQWLPRGSGAGESGCSMSGIVYASEIGTAVLVGTPSTGGKNSIYFSKQ